MTFAHDTPADVSDAHTLIRCDNCGRHGWHLTERCPEPVADILCFHEPMTDTPPAELAKIATPADAEHIGPWVDETGTGTWGRYVRGARRAIAGVDVVIAGWQSADGTVARKAHVSANDAELDAAGLRKLAAAVLDAADELDQVGR